MKLTQKCSVLFLTMTFLIATSAFAETQVSGNSPETRLESTGAEAKKLYEQLTVQENVSYYHEKFETIEAGNIERTHQSLKFHHAVKSYTNSDHSLTIRCTKSRYAQTVTPVFETHVWLNSYVCQSTLFTSADGEGHLNAAQSIELTSTLGMDVYTDYNPAQGTTQLASKIEVGGISVDCHGTPKQDLSCSVNFKK